AAKYAAKPATNFRRRRVTDFIGSGDSVATLAPTPGSGPGFHPAAHRGRAHPRSGRRSAHALPGENFENDLRPLVGEAARTGPRRTQRTVPRQLREPGLRPVVPLALVVRRQDMEPRTAPPVREIAGQPRRLDPEPDPAGLVLLGQPEPLGAALDVPLPGVVAEPEHRPVLVRLRTELHHFRAAEVPQPEHLDLQEQRAADQGLGRVEVHGHDGWVREPERFDPRPRPRERTVRGRRAGILLRHHRLRVVAVPPLLRLHGFPRAREVRAPARAFHEPPLQLELAPPPAEPPLRHDPAVGRPPPHTPARHPLPARPGVLPPPAALPATPFLLRVHPSPPSPRTSAGPAPHGRPAPPPPPASPRGSHRPHRSRPAPPAGR